MKVIELINGDNTIPISVPDDAYNFYVDINLQLLWFRQPIEFGYRINKVLIDEAFPNLINGFLYYPQLKINL